MKKAVFSLLAAALLCSAVPAHAFGAGICGNRFGEVVFL